MNLSVERIAEIEELAKKVRSGSHRWPKEDTFSTTNIAVYVHSYRDDPDRSFRGDTDLFKKICKLLERNGWSVTLDPRIDDSYPTLNKSHRMASKGDLRAEIEYYPAGLKFELYPIYNKENPNGPRYGFHKYETMNYQDKKRSELIVQKLKGYLIKRGFKENSKPTFKCPREEIEFRMRESCHFREYDTNSGEFPGIQSYNNKDADKKTLCNGQVKYFWGYNGKLSRGVIYHNINNMWWVLSGGEVRNIAAHDFFDADSPLFGRRKSDSKNQSSLAKEIRKAVDAGNTQRVSLLRDLLWKARGNSPDEERYVIQCIEHEDRNVLWWAENSCGYTESIDFAGRYTLKEAQEICRNDDRQEKYFKESEYHLAVASKKKAKKIDKRYKRAA